MNGATHCPADPRFNEVERRVSRTEDAIASIAETLHTLTRVETELQATNAKVDGLCADMKAQAGVLKALPVMENVLTLHSWVLRGAAAAVGLWFFQYLMHR